MSVWYCIPSKRPPEEAEKVLKLWRERGYKIALWLDQKPDLAPWYTRADGTFGACPGLALINWGMSMQWAFPPDNLGPCGASLILVGSYRGYAASVNSLVRRAANHEPDADWFVTGGDDVSPDPNHNAEDIARQCSDYFRNHHIESTGETFNVHPTFGVMQPTGDRFADGSIDHICGSPWMGREFCRRMYRGNGPLWPEYTRFFMDEELQAVAIKLGVLCQRPDLIHLHNWYARADRSLTSGTKPMPIPEHLRAQETHWNPEKAIFAARKAAGFPGHEPLEA